MKSVVLLGSSALMFAIMAVLVRLAGLQGIPASQTTLVRFLFGLAVVAVLHTRGAARVRIHRPGWLAARGITGGVAILLYFLSLASVRGEGAVPLTNSVFLGNSYFIYAPIFGALLIRERIRPSTALMVLPALLGLYLVAEPDFRDLRAGNVYGFGAGIMAAVALVTVRELRKSETPASIFLSLCLFGAIAAAILLPFQEPVLPNALGWALLLGVGILATVAQFGLTYAMRYVDAGEGSLIQMTSVIFSSLAGILWLGDPFNGRIALGAVLVIGGAVYISLTHNNTACRDVANRP